MLITGIIVSQRIYNSFFSHKANKVKTRRYLFAPNVVVFFLQLNKHGIKKYFKRAFQHRQLANVDLLRAPSDDL